MDQYAGKRVLDEADKVDVKVGLWRGFFWEVENWFSLKKYPSVDDDHRLEQELLQKYTKK